ncbi:MAG: MFS transporter [Bacilli bacterium]|nr:MFS transporter [Bacilli bacterium]
MFKGLNLTGTYRGDIIPKRTKWTYSISGCFRDASYTLIAVFLLLFIQEYGVIADDFPAMFGVISALLIAFRVFDGFNDPIMGVIIEKVHFKTGKYKPWIFIGSFISALTYLALFCGPVAFSWCRGWAYVGWFAVFYLLWDVGYTMNDIAYWSMLPSMSSKEQERAKVTSIVLIFCNIGEFAVSATIPFLTQTTVFGRNGYWGACIVITSLFLISQACIYFLCTERERGALDKNAQEQVSFKDLFRVLRDNSQARTMIFVVIFYQIAINVQNGLMTNLLYITVGYNSGKALQSIITIVNTVAVLIAPIFVPLLIKKFSLRKVFNVSLIAMFASRIVFFFYDMPFGSFITAPSPMVDSQLNVWFAACFSIISILMVVTQTLVYNAVLIMMSNTIEYNEYKFGKRQEAVIFSLRPFSTKIASSLNQGVTYSALMATNVAAIMSQISQINDDPSIKDKESAINEVLTTVTNGQVWGLKLFMVIIPLVFMALSYWIVRRYYIIDEPMYEKMCKEIRDRNDKKVKKPRAIKK